MVAAGVRPGTYGYATTSGFGMLEIGIGASGITGARFLLQTCAPRLPSCLLADELDRYFAGERVEFASGVDLGGVSGFGREVLEAMRRIPYGRVATYGMLALAVGRPGAARAVGAACRSNPVGLVVPCHRVVAAGGPGGYSGSDPGNILLKLSLLRLEGAVPGSGGRFGPPALLPVLPG